MNAPIQAACPGAALETTIAGTGLQRAPPFGAPTLVQRLVSYANWLGLVRAGLAAAPSAAPSGAGGGRSPPLPGALQPSRFGFSGASAVGSSSSAFWLTLQRKCQATLGFRPPGVWKFQSITRRDLCAKGDAYGGTACDASETNSEPKAQAIGGELGGRSGCGSVSNGSAYGSETKGEKSRPAVATPSRARVVVATARAPPKPPKPRSGTPRPRRPGSPRGRCPRPTSPRPPQWRSEDHSGEGSRQ